MYGPDSSSPKSNTGTMLGWLSEAAARASSRNRARKSGSCAELGPQELDGDVPLELRVARPVDRRHAALPEQLEQPVAAAEGAPDLGHGVVVSCAVRAPRGAGRILPYAPRGFRAQMSSDRR